MPAELPRFPSTRNLLSLEAARRTAAMTLRIVRLPRLFRDPACGSFTRLSNLFTDF